VLNLVKHKKYKAGRDQVSTKLPFLLRYFAKKVLPEHSDLERESKKILNSWNNHHNLSLTLDKTLKGAII